MRCRSNFYLCGKRMKYHENVLHMAKKSYFVRYTTIVKALKKGEKSYQEICKSIEDAYRDYGLEPLSYSLRTFQRDINDILSLFEIEIACNSESLYYIKANDSAYKEMNMRMIEDFDLSHTIRFQNNVEQYIMLQSSNIRGTEYIHPLLSACDHRKAVKFSYRFVWQEYTASRMVYPHGLKEFDHMWYLVAWDPQKKGIRTFGLDRIQDFEVTEHVFKRQENFSMEKYFEHYYGIWGGDEQYDGPVVIRLLSTAKYANYLKAVPLHHTQKIVEEDEFECLFELRLTPSWDFTQKLMTMADQVQVVSPESLRDELVEALEYGIGYQNCVDEDDEY